VGPSPCSAVKRIHCRLTWILNSSFRLVSTCFQSLSSSESERTSKSGSYRRITRGNMHSGARYSIRGHRAAGPLQPWGLAQSTLDLTFPDSLLLHHTIHSSAISLAEHGRQTPPKGPAVARLHGRQHNAVVGESTSKRFLRRKTSGTLSSRLQ